MEFNATQFIYGNNFQQTNEGNEDKDVSLEQYDTTRIDNSQFIYDSNQEGTIGTNLNNLQGF